MAGKGSGRAHVRAGTKSIPFTSALALAFALGACGGGGSTSEPTFAMVDPPALVFAEGDTVGSLEVVLPEAESFVLRATVPVPKGTYPRLDGAQPFQLSHRNAGAFPAQAEIVTRYPRYEDGADVVEILGRVTRPTGSSAGDRVHYSVLYQPTTALAFAPEPDVAALLAGAGNLVARTHDCFGNLYQSDLWTDARAESGTLRVLRTGVSADQRATHSVLQPEPVVEGETGTLPHSFGVHAYLTQWQDEPFVSLDLRVHNAFSGKDGTTSLDDPLIELYFADFELVLPTGWVVLNAFTDPYFGAPYDEGDRRVWPIVAPMGDGTLHVLHQQGQFERRLALCREGDEARALAYLREENLAFCRDGENGGGMQLFSWWNESTARYFPQRQVLPWLDAVGLDGLRAADAAELDARSTQVATGSSGEWPTQSTGMGWAHPWGISEAGMVSGQEIYLYEGVECAAAASRDGYRMMQLRHRMYTDRQHNVLFDLEGNHTRWETWAVSSPQGDYLPVWWYNSPMLWASDPFGFEAAPTFQNDWVLANGKAPAYQGALLAYDSIDQAHLVRYMHTPKALIWLGNDALAKEDAWAQAEGILFAYTDLPQDLWGAIMPTSLFAAQNFVNEHPRNGVFYGRGEAWGLDTVCTAYSTQTPEWRARVKPWFGKVIAMLERAQSSCSGTIQNTPLGNVFGGQYACRQSIEAAITENALVGMRESVYRGDDPTHAEQVNLVLGRSIYGMIGSLVWSNAHHGPWALIGVGPADITQPQFCDHVPSDGNYGFADHYQIWSSFAYAYRITQDPRFLSKAEEALGVADLHAMEANPLENLHNKCALLALVQRMTP
ncbi:MAG: hypothetical protein IPJ77_15455 [Planctomycetes bacterium]|nr:hypothetical protein [Planctomycetota bacterium]